YSQALFFIFPSLYEGFGFPAVEAMSLGCPTALSNTSSLKEIGKNAALLFEPTETLAIMKAMRTLINDKKERTKFAMQGQERSRDFTWKHYYHTFIKTLETA